MGRLANFSQNNKWGGDAINKEVGKNLQSY